MSESIFSTSLFLFHFFTYTTIIMLNLINITFCSGCAKDTLITNVTCFNDLLKFDKYRAGHFVTYKNGDMIAEFSDDGDGDEYGFLRIFYGLKQNGRYYFPNETPTREFNVTKIDQARGRYESINLLVVLEDDAQRNKEYLFSTSSYGSLTELHDMENQDYTCDKTISFMGKSIFSFQYSMVEVEKDNTIFYFIGFTHSSSTEEKGDRLDIKKFGFTSFDLNTYNSYNSKQITIEDNIDNRIIDLFVLDDL